VCDGDKCDAKDCWEETHGDVWNIWGVYGADVFEIEGPVETPHVRNECEWFSERWVDGDVVPCLKGWVRALYTGRTGEGTYFDLLDGELPEVDLIEDDAVKLSESEETYSIRY